MASEPAISGSTGPLSGLFGPALFPRTFRASTDAPFNSDPKDLDSVHQFMKTMGSKSHDKLLEEAKAIVDNGSELLNTNFVAFTASLGIDDASMARGNEKPQERRPGLGRKKARFSLKSNASQPSVSLEPSLNIDQLQDPEEYFAAIEKLENAKKEIERQKGSSIPVLDENNLLQNTRRRRPGLLGKSVTYKHRYSSVISENEDTFLASQESSEPNAARVPDSQPLEGTTDSDVELREIDVAGSITKSENSVNKILDELLSSNSEDLDENGAVFLLQERLQIKPIELSKLSVPDFHDIERSNYMDLGKSLSKARRTSFDVQHLLKGTRRETPTTHKQVHKSPVNSISSPTPPRSPFASISLLKKRILQSNPLRDPFQPLNIELSPPKNLSPSKQVDGEPGDVTSEKRSNTSQNLKSVNEDAITKLTVSDSAQEKVISDGSDTRLDLSMDKNSTRQSSRVDDRPEGSHGNMEVHCDDHNMDGSTEDTENNDLMEGPDWNMENVEDGPRQVLSSLTSRDSVHYSTISSSATDGDGFTEMEKNIEEMSGGACPAQMDVTIEESTVPKNLNSESLSDESHSATKEFYMCMPPTATESDSIQEAEKLPPKKKKSPVGKRERRILSSRPSIADAGTSFETGVRRSKRIKTRPLEYWKGERLLYGRVNSSLKLIGLKYISPSKDDGKLKVKPFISAEYNELLELAAKH